MITDLQFIYQLPNQRLAYVRTCLFWNRAPTPMSVIGDMFRKLLVFLRRPETFPELLFEAVGVSPHSINVCTRYPGVLYNWPTVGYCLYTESGSWRRWRLRRKINAWWLGAGVIKRDREERRRLCQSKLRTRFNNLWWWCFKINCICYFFTCLFLVD